MKQCIYTYFYIAILLFFSCSTTRGAGVFFNAFGHFARQISPTVNLLGIEGGAGVNITDWIGVELYSELDYYKITFTDDTRQNLDINYGGGVRYYPFPWVYARVVFGRLYRKYSSTLTDDVTLDDWRYGGGLGVILPVVKPVEFNLGGNIYRYHKNRHNYFSVFAGVAFNIDFGESSESSSDSGGEY